MQKLFLCRKITHLKYHCPLQTQPNHLLKIPHSKSLLLAVPHRPGAGIFPPHLYGVPVFYQAVCHHNPELNSSITDTWDRHGSNGKADPAKLKGARASPPGAPVYIQNPEGWMCSRTTHMGREEDAGFSFLSEGSCSSLAFAHSRLPL